MKYEIRYEMLKLADLVAPPYNPRSDIERGSTEYKELMRSIKQYGMVEPPVVNIHNMRCIGGNQRLVVLKDLGWTDVLCSVIDQPDEKQEKKLCLALNRIEGRWDNDKLGCLLRDDSVTAFETGFDLAELEVYRQLGDVQEPDVGDTYGEDEEYDEEDSEEYEDEPEESGEDDNDVKMTLIRVGTYTFRVSISRYNEMIESIRDNGIFTDDDVIGEFKRRLRCND